jgi:hypothetical protein
MQHGHQNISQAREIHHVTRQIHDSPIPPKHPQVVFILFFISINGICILQAIWS